MSRYLFSGSYQPAAEKRIFSTCIELAKTSMPGDFAFISIGSFWRSCCSGTTWYSTWMPVSLVKSGIIFWSTV